MFVIYSPGSLCVPLGVYDLLAAVLHLYQRPWSLQVIRIILCSESARVPVRTPSEALARAQWGLAEGCGCSHRFCYSPPLLTSWCIPLPPFMVDMGFFWSERVLGGVVGDLSVPNKLVLGGAVRAEGAPIDFVTHPPCCL